MHSKQLRQELRLHLDAMGMRGPVTKRAVAEKVLHSKHWSVADEWDAKLAYLMGEVGSMFDEKLTQHFIDTHLSSLPDKLRNTLANCPSWICISKRGGRGAQHVLAIKATQENWEAYIDLKEYVETRVRQARQNDQDVLKLLRMMGAQTLEDLFT